MRHRWIWLLAGWLIGCGLTGCNQVARPPAEEVRPEPSWTKQPEATIAAPASTTTSGSVLTVEPAPILADHGLQPQVRQAQEDLAHRLALNISQIDLVKVELVVWPDSSLGCPQPGKAYQQVPQDGALIRLGVGQQRYDYHSGGTVSLFLCEPGAVKDDTDQIARERLLTTVPLKLTQLAQEADMSDATPIPTPLDAGLQSLLRQAREDLARQLGLDIDQITVLEVREVVWPDSSLGCPEEGIVYQQVPREGLLIRLGVGKSMYFYHSDKNQAPFLCEQRLDIFKVTPKVDELVPPPDSEID